jgi:hypothetical protein
VINCSACNTPIHRLQDVRMVNKKPYCQDVEACQKRTKEKPYSCPACTHTDKKQPDTPVAISTARDRYGWRSLPSGSRYLGPEKGGG